ncbi:MAG: NUDIX pyrophosphatase [Ignavibacteria bacterium]|mgnify:CR=1 FL=1|nr:NUDIX pyrophosphatase [Ignavibacteria bacterium]
MEVVSYMIEAHIIKITGNEINFLLLKRSEKEIYPGIWQMVTGKIKPEEKAYNTALREIFEETGLKPLRFYTVPKVNSFYSEKTDTICMIPVFLAEVEKDCEVIISDEHSEYKWVNKEDAKKLLAWPGQRDAVDIIYEYFTNNRSLLNFTRIEKG